MGARFAPAPDFRYVGLRRYKIAAGPRGLAVSAFAAVASSAFFLGGGAWSALAGALAVAAGVQLVRVRYVQSAHWMVRGAKPTEMAIVPWGVVVQEPQRRALRWASIRGFQFETVHSKDAGAPTTLYSVVLVQTDTDELAGMAPGAVGLDRLLAYLAQYQAEQSRCVALNFSGSESADVTEPFARRLLESVRQYIGSPQAVDDLGLPALGYRGAVAAVATPTAHAALRALLRDEGEPANDKRAFAAIVAAELGATELGEEVVALVQCPHPSVALAAKAASLRLGVASMRAGTLSELDAFVEPLDLQILTEWIESPPRSAPSA